MLDVPEHPAQEQAGQRRAGQLDDDVARDPAPREVPAQREGQRHGRVQVRARDRAHEQDDRCHHQARRDDRGIQADLPLRVQQAAARSGQHQREGTKQLREQPPPFLARVVEILTPAELEREHAAGVHEGWSLRRPLHPLGRRRAHRARLRPGPARPLIVRPVHRHAVCQCPVLPSTHRRSFTTRSASPILARSSTEAARIIVTRREVSWNLVVWRVCSLVVMALSHVATGRVSSSTGPSQPVLAAESPVRFAGLADPC
jgi:hypothetical protein